MNSEVLNIYPRGNSQADQTIIKEAQQGYFDAYVRGATLADVPLGDLITEDLPRKIPGLDFKTRLHNISFAASSHYEKTPLATQTAQMLVDTPYHTNFLSPESMHRLREVPEYKASFDLLDSLDMLHLPPPKELGPSHEENRLYDIMARHPRYLTGLRYLFGLDQGIFQFYNLNHTASELRPDIRDYLQELLWNGVTTREELEESIPREASYLVGVVFTKSFGADFVNKGPMSGLFYWSGDFKDVYKNDSLIEDGIYLPQVKTDKSNNRPSPEYAKPIMPVLELLRKRTVQWMKLSGWSNPDAFFDLPFDLLRRGFFANYRPGEIYTYNWRHRLRNFEEILERFLKFTIPGKMLTETQKVMLHAASEANFHTALEEDDICTSYPVTSDHTNIHLINSLPEDVLIDTYRRRHNLRETLQRNIDWVTSNSSAIGRERPSFAEDIERYMADDSYVRGDKIEDKNRLLDQLRKMGLIIDTPGWCNKLLEQVIEIAGPPRFVPLDRINKMNLTQINNLLKQVRDLYFDSEGKKGFYGDYFNEAVANIDKLLEEEGEVVPNTLELNPGIPLVFLGANGEGKSTVIATILQQHKAPGKVVAERAAILPADTLIVASGDRVELEGKERVFWGRAEGKSSFVMELDSLIERMHLIETANHPMFIAGDELGRRTDQLNGMALLGMELIADMYGNHLGVYSSHSNSLNGTLGPLIKYLGGDISWNTMRKFQVTPIDETTEVKSNAFDKAKPFLPPDLGMVWAEKHGVEVTPSELGKEYINRSYKQLHRERLYQLGWLRKFSYRETFDGMARYLLGFDYDSPQKNNYRDWENVQNILVDTVLDPRWELNKQARTWIDTMHKNQEKVTESMKVLNDLADFYHRVDYFFQIPLERQNLKELEVLKNEFTFFKENSKELINHFNQLLQLFPDYPWELTEEKLDQLEKIDSLIKFRSAYSSYVDPLIPLEALRNVACNMDEIHLTPVSPNTEDIDIQNIWGYTLTQNNKDKDLHPVVRNSIHLDRSLIFTGPQGSGKTEALFSLSESLMAASLFGFANAESMSMGDNWEIMPLITVPDFPKSKEKEKRVPSSGEKEIRDRLSSVADFCKSLPQGVKPIIIMDEVLSSTNTSDASEGIRAVKEYVEGKGGIVIIATHSHQAVWDMEKEEAAGGRPSLKKYVGLFDTPDAYKWFDGHGESMGIEVAEIKGLPQWYVQVARSLRNYFLDTRDYQEIPQELIEQYGEQIKSLMSADVIFTSKKI